mmetsp:Transcript_9251/g.9093  ORF Transcript_9251/g.9093 Transcript_9251/m.9093 type:complete len:123 (-) Transcript_9251:110-478(-)
MEAESIVIALVREYTAEITLNLAIYWESSRFSKRGKSFLLEVKDSNNEYQATAAFKDRSAVVLVISASLTNHQASIQLTLESKKNQVSVMSNILNGGHGREHNEKIIGRFVNALESECPIPL